jgi:hypothetical protein
MKLRILDDTIRLRLDREEVDRIGAGGTAWGLTRFPNDSTLGYGLRVAGSALDARFERDTLIVDVPAAVASRWARDERAVSIEHTIATGTHALDILIEKDFECLEPRAGEDQRNRFPNPKATAER